MFKAGTTLLALELFYGYGRVVYSQRLLTSAPSSFLITGDVDEGKRQLCELLGVEDCESRIAVDPEAGAVAINFGSIDLSRNEGALLLSQLTRSEYVYNFTLGNEYRSAAGIRSLGGDAIVNNSNTFDPPRFRIDKPAVVRPPSKVDSVVAIDPAHARYRDSEGRPVRLSAIIFHELAEAYSKVDLEKPYIDFDLGSVGNQTIIATPAGFQQGAHNDAVQREIIWRNQMPHLQSTGRAGDMLRRDP